MMKFGQWLAAERKRKAFTQLGDDDRAVVRAVVVALKDRRKKSPAG